MSIKNSPIIVIGLDGLSFSFVKKKMNIKELPNLHRIINQGTFKKLKTVYPTLSPVIWTSYLTGKNPGKHNIFGFIDRNLKSYKTFIPDARHVTGLTLLNLLSYHHFKVISINLPVTYPPYPINGILISDFLCPNIDQIAYPREIVSLLKKMNYRIDVDTNLAVKSKEEFLNDIKITLDRRIEVAYYFMANFQWDFFHLQIMEIDRLCHYFWDEIQSEDSLYELYFKDFFEKIDSFIGEVYYNFGEKSLFILLSDHGFTNLEKIIYLNKWFKERGCLAFSGEIEDFTNINPKSLVYVLTPGRVYINFNGQNFDYYKKRNLLQKMLFELKDPDTDKKVIKDVLFKEALFSGPAFLSAPDMLAFPVKGYDLRGDLNTKIIMEDSFTSGMHDPEEALFFINRNIKTFHPKIVDILPTILDFLQIPKPDDLDGESLIFN
ncbi:MAG: alkaline phosphatase family protein [Thermodesulfobacteriota bacterium]|nr:alkaline phosphatase family protein [Thermodesulfobacteriota bacterium]